MRLTDKKCNFGHTNSSNKLNSITIGANTYNYLYDNTGNLVQENSSRFFQWDAGNNMRCFYNQAGTSEPTVYAQYLYDAAGNRIKKIVRTQGGAYESVSYIGGLFDYKTDSTNGQATSYIMDDVSRIAMIRTGADFGDSTPTIKYNLEDHLGSSVVLLDTNGTLVNKEEYYPYGETSFGSYAKKRYRFSGKERDAESGLYYYGARYYLPMSCRFVSCDPLANKSPEWTSYRSFFDNPIKFIDPDGQYETKREAKEAKKEAKKAGFNVGKVYGKKGNYGFNAYTSERYLHFHKAKDFTKYIQTEKSNNDGSITTKSSKESNLTLPPPGAIVDGAEEFGKRGHKLRKTTAPLKSTGKVKYYDNSWGGNKYIKTERVFAKKLTRGLADNMPVLGNVLDGMEIWDGIQKDGGTIGKNTVKEVAGVFGGAGGATAGAWGGAAIGTAIFPGIGTVIGGAIGALLGSWAGETASEAIIENAIK